MSKPKPIAAIIFRRVVSAVVVLAALLIAVFEIREMIGEIIAGSGGGNAMLHLMFFVAVACLLYVAVWVLEDSDSR